MPTNPLHPQMQDDEVIAGWCFHFRKSRSGNGCFHNSFPGQRLGTIYLQPDGTKAADSIRPIYVKAKVMLEQGFVINEDRVAVRPEFPEPGNQESSAPAP